MCYDIYIFVGERERERERGRMRFRYGKIGRKTETEGRRVEPDPVPDRCMQRADVVFKKGPKRGKQFLFVANIFNTREVRCVRERAGHNGANLCIGAQWFNEGKASHKSIHGTLVGAI